jgi:hypothetical protein
MCLKRPDCSVEVVEATVTNFCAHGVDVTAPSMNARTIRNASVPFSFVAVLPA